MRPLKYRAWRNSKMWYGNEEEESEELYGNFVDNINDALSDPSIIWLQFTGLYDQDGEEIYEGDIVKLSRDGPRVTKVYKAIGLVEFGLHDVGFDCDYGSTGPAYGYYLTQVNKSVSGYDLKGDCMIGEYVTMEDSRNWKVLGNMYQNPELLQ